VALLHFMHKNTATIPRHLEGLDIAQDTEAIQISGRNGPCSRISWTNQKIRPL